MREEVDYCVTAPEFFGEAATSLADFCVPIRVSSSGFFAVVIHVLAVVRRGEERESFGNLRDDCTEVHVWVCCKTSKGVKFSRCKAVNALLKST